MQANNSTSVKISKASISAGDEVTITYTGDLAKNENVCAHVGYGDSWENKEFIPMTLEKNVCKATIKISSSDCLKICFKDVQDNWDNNSGNNYSFEVTVKKAPAKKASKPLAEEVNTDSVDEESVSDSAPKEKKTRAKTSAAKKSKSE
jgi:hypothetical protein